MLQCDVISAHMSCDECFNRTSFCIWEKGTQILVSKASFAKVTIILALLYVPTVNQLLPRAGRMFKALWDRSECVCTETDKDVVESNCYSVSQSVAACCSPLQRVLQCDGRKTKPSWNLSVAVCCSVWQCVARQTKA